MSKKLIAVLASLLIVVAMTIPSTAQYDAKPRCWAVDDICQTTANIAWDNCYTSIIYYLPCLVTYHATYNECMSAEGCSGQSQPKAQ